MLISRYKIMLKQTNHDFVPQRVFHDYKPHLGISFVKALTVGVIALCFRIDSNGKSHEKYEIEVRH